MRLRRGPAFVVAVTGVLTVLVGAGAGTGAVAAPVKVEAAKPVAVQARGKDPEAAVALQKTPTVVWPKAGAAEVVAEGLKAASPVRAGSLPVWVGQPVKGGGGGTARVEVLDRAATARIGVKGMLLRLGHTDKVARKVAVDVDYAGFRNAYGGDYGSRLALVRLPECALTTPKAKGCGSATMVAARNDTGAGRLSAEVTDGLFAVTAAPEGSAGSFKPTSLAPSATWQVGLQSGDFTWSYPITVPQLPGQVPEVGLAYSSGAVDGRVASTNNQPSWIGEGFDYQPGFIERSYKPCSDDGQAATIGDLCFASDNATVVLPGLTSELVHDPVKGWRAEQDDGWRVDLLTGSDNGDAGDAGDAGKGNGEYWRLTSPDGTQYFLGRDRLPEATAGSPRTNSTWTAPVFGNGDGEPCHKATFDASWCQQAYRWNLDFVIDPHGDAMSYWYERETNYYGRNGRSDQPTPYTRAGQLVRIEYGQRVGSVYTTPAPGRVLFTLADRCIPGTSCVHSQPQNWPDTPWDQWCGSASCTVLSPTFWTTRRLSKITTQVYADGAPKDVDSWTLTQSYPVPGDTTSPALWVDSIRRSGLVGATSTLPAVTFDGEKSENRVDAAEGIEAMYKRRIERIYTETGGEISVTYQPTQCRRSALPQVDSNLMRCFPAIWGSARTEDWFHKYVVTEVREIDLVGGNRDKVTSYEYDFGNGSGWHHDDAELVPNERKSWGQWRGYQRVRVRTGDQGENRTRTDYLFFRGMDGDINKSGSPDSSKVDDIPDQTMWRGFARMVTAYDGDTDTVVSRTVSTPANLGTTASRPRGSGSLEAHLTDVESEETVTPLATGGQRTTRVSYTYDSKGRLTETDDLGDISTADDDTCVLTEYAENQNEWIIDPVKRQVTEGVQCAATASYPADLVSDKRYYYDGQDTWGAAPTRGDVTRVEEASGWSGGAPVYTTTSRTVVDAQGRPTKQYDATDQLTQTTYTPTVGGPVTQTVVTDPKSFTTTTTREPRRGSTLATVNANGGRTAMSYDPLGRLTKVWLPGRDTGDSPNLEYAYTVRADGPSAVTSRTLLAGSTYRLGYELFDGLLRKRQTQSASPTGGRVITDTLYDSQGRIATVNEPRNTTGTAEAALVDAPVEAVTSYEYDGAGRRSAEVLSTNDNELRRTTTTYEGDRTSVDPPDGDTARTEITDARGRVVAVREYSGGAPTGPYDETRYTYTQAGKLSTVTDPVGNTWRYFYDLRGRQTRVEAPDTGATISGYDAEGRLLSSTDARGRTLAYTYDALGRKTGLYEGSPSGTRLAEWTYDTGTNGKGLPAASIRYVGGKAYESRVDSYDLRGHRTATSAVVPSAETGLAGTYRTSYTYNENDQPTSVTQPAGGDLTGEKVDYTYDDLGLPQTMGSADTTYVFESAYTPLGEPETYRLGQGDKQVLHDFGYQEGTRRLNSAGVVKAADTTVIADVRYGYDAAGNVLRVADGAVGDTQCFRYDYLRRLTEAWAVAAGECGDVPELSVLGGPAPYWQSFRYDKVGNRTSEVRHAAGGDTTRSYAYPVAGGVQPHTVRSVVTSGPGGSRTDTFGYDASGNITQRPGQVLDWDAEGHLASVTEGPKATSYLYDADGNRLIRRDPGGTTLYLGDTELRFANGATKGTRYYRYAGTVIAVRTAGKLAWLIPDAQGTAGIAVDAATLEVTRRHQLPFGAARGSAVTDWPGERGFVGGTTDTPTGLIHLGARELDPLTGRFISADPVVDQQDLQQVNGYAYASNNPTTFTDADGLKVSKPVPHVTKQNRSLTGVRWVTKQIPPSSSRKLKQDRIVEWIKKYPDAYEEPYDGSYEVYSNNYGLDADRSSVGSCFSGNPRPAIACRDKQTTTNAVRLVSQWEDRGCGGWNQCITPRPVDLVQYLVTDDDSTTTHTSTSVLGGLLDRILRPGQLSSSGGGGSVILG
ncbi:RHS repeat-associated core domain-containing protein [Streptomyces sp. NPDC005820]|uniref:RHS repeat domain-containing protein n=1 Tax=Streptomyces sp. NPDC005820 TaxID=3157069 RepID=UPI0033E9B6D4